MTAVLITGGAGFLGSHVAQHCLELGYKTVVLDDLSGGFVENIPHDAVFALGSVNDAEQLSRLFASHKFDYVYHLAAYAAEGLSHFVRAFNYTNNVVGSMNVINECVKHEVKRLVFTSSIAVYGTGQIPFIESMTPQPEDPYGIAKYAVEMDLKAAQAVFGLEYTIFRPYNIYGPRQNLGDRYRNVVGIFMRQCLHGEPLTVFGDGTQTRCFSYVDDVAPCIAKAPTTPYTVNQVFNIGASGAYSVNDLANAVGYALGMTPTVQHVPPRHEVKHAIALCKKAEELFGSAQISLEEGLHSMAAWARTAGIKHSQMPSVEIWKNLPEAWRD